jgi:hypothetical protein
MHHPLYLPISAWSAVAADAATDDAGALTDYHEYDRRGDGDH